MTSIEHTSPWKKFIMLHETTCSGCPSHGMGDISGNIWTTYNTTYNIDNGCGSGFWGRFKSGIGGILGGMLGGLLSGWLGNAGTCYWGGGGGSCGWNINQLLDPNLAIQQTLQSMQNNFANMCSNAGSWGGLNNLFSPATNNSTPSTYSADKAEKTNKPKSNNDDEKKSTDNLTREVDELLKQSEITQDELQRMYDKLNEAKNDENKSEIENLQKQITDKAKDNNITLNTGNQHADNTGATTTNKPQTPDSDGITTNNDGKANGNGTADTKVKAAEVSDNADATSSSEAANIKALEKLGLDEESAKELAKIGVKPSAAGNNTITLPNVLSKANLIVLRDAIFGTSIHVAAAHNPNSKGDQWIIGTIGDINGDDNNPEFSIDCAGSQPPNTLGFKYKVAKQDDGYKIDLYDDASENQAKAIGYGHKARKYAFTNGQLVYADESGGTVVSKTYKN